MLTVSGQVIKRMGIGDVAELYGGSRGTVERWVAGLGLPAFKFGRHVFFDPDELKAWEQRHRVSSAVTTEDFEILMGHDSGRNLVPCTGGNLRPQGGLQL